MSKFFITTFIFSIIAGTAFDFCSKELLSSNSIFINSVLFIAVLSTIASFCKIWKEVPIYSGLPLSSQPRYISPIPIRNLMNTNDPLLMIRFIAAFLVFVTHMMILLNPTEAVIKQSYGFLKGGAHAGMQVFFTLSGFLMGKAFITGRYELTKEGVLRFYKSRWIRIFPLMFIVSFFLFILQYPQVIRFDALSTIRLLTFNYYGTTIHLNGIGDMWSLSVEFQYYLIAPFIFYIFDTVIKQRGKFFGIAIAVVTIIFSFLLKHCLIHFLPVSAGLKGFMALGTLLGNLPFFLVGYIFNYVSLQPSERTAKFVTNGCFILITLISFCWLGRGAEYYRCIPLVTGIFITILDSVRNTSTYIELKNFSLMRIIQILGVLSYGFYLWHSGIGYIESGLFPNGFSTFSSYIFEVLYIAFITLFISLITYILVEDRFNAYKPVPRDIK